MYSLAQPPPTINGLISEVADIDIAVLLQFIQAGLDLGVHSPTTATY